MSTPAPNALDVRLLPAGRKPPTILAIFEDLDAGDSFVLVDDSDPMALRTGIEAERWGPWRKDCLRGPCGCGVVSRSERGIHGV